MVGPRGSRRDLKPVPETKAFYVTTPIYYVNDLPHIGTAYTTVVADAIARFRRLQGRNVVFATGTDEHAEKVVAAAERQGMTPRQWTDKLADGYRESWAKLDITYDDFIRTSEPRHHRAVQEVFRRLTATGDIYRGSYEGWYCNRCATYYPDSDVKNGACPSPDCAGATVEHRKQPAYFFRASAYADRLRAHIEADPGFLFPDFRRNEVLAFLDQGLRDACISRPSNGWGVPVPGDEAHQVYVWFDALINYLTVAGWPDDAERLRAVWPADVHVMAKDIFPRFHATLWPAMLMALELPLPRNVVAHGYWLAADQKISKSAGGLVSVEELVEELQSLVPIERDIACDAVRHYYLREMAFGHDASFSRESLWGRLNADLANDLGNVLNRSLPLVERAFDGVVPEGTLAPGVAAQIEAAARAVPERVDAYDFRGALDSVWVAIGGLNKYLDTAAPWNLVRDPDKGPAADCLFTTCEAIRCLSVLLYPFIPHAAMEIRRQLGLPEEVSGTLDAELSAPPRVAGLRVQRGNPIFPRVKVPRPIAVEPKPEPKVEAEGKPMITYEEFAKLDLRVGTCLAAERVEGADKLYRLRVDLGCEQRELVAGIAHVFGPEEIVGKQLVVVANLAPARIRGIESHGMILATGEQNPTALVTLDRPVPNGERVR